MLDNKTGERMYSKCKYSSFARVVAENGMNGEGMGPWKERERKIARRTYFIRCYINMDWPHSNDDADMRRDGAQTRGEKIIITLVRFSGNTL